MEMAAASLQRPESDLDGASSSYVPSLASPTTRDSLDEGYDPDETLKVIVYDNEDIKIKSSGIYYYSSDEEESEARDDDQDVVFVEQKPPELMENPEELLENPESEVEDLPDMIQEETKTKPDIVQLHSSYEDSQDVSLHPVLPAKQLNSSYEDSQDVEIHPLPRDKPDIVQLHSSYEDSQDVEIYQIPIREQGTIDDINEEDIDAFEQFTHGDIVEIAPGKFCMVRDVDSLNPDAKIELMSMKSQTLSYGELDNQAPVDANVKVCNDILKGISFDEISLSSIKRLRAQNRKLRRMSNISSLDSDTKVFNEIWNAVKQDKFLDSSDNSDTNVFNVLNKSLSSDSSQTGQSLNVFKPIHETIPEVESRSSIESWSLPENPGTSPVYYPASQQVAIDPDADPEGFVGSPEKMSHISGVSDKSAAVLRERCSSRTEKCHCYCDVICFDFIELRKRKQLLSQISE